MIRRTIRLTKLLSLFFAAVLLNACGGNGDNDSESSNETEEVSKFGGTFKMSLGSYYNTVQINEIQKLETSQVYWQIFEGLVKYNPKTLEIEPALATSWTVSEDGLTYVFNLKENVYFHDNACFDQGKGRLLTTDDVIYSLEKVYENKVSNTAYDIFKGTIVGGDAYFEGDADSISGITVKGNEISFQLEKANLSFIQKLASIFGSILPRESMQGDEFIPVGSGPFTLDKLNASSELITMVKNENYHEVDEEGDKLPYLDTLVFMYADDNDEEMELFWSGGLTYIRKVPITKISEVLEERIGDFESNPPKYILNSEPELTTTYLELNMNQPVFKNKKVRQALNFAINKKKLVEKILKNQAYDIGKFGIVPPLPKVFADYDFEGVEDVSYTYNPQMAKDLLAQAGFPEGKNFPSLQMQFKSGSTDYLIASEIQNQWRSVLNINVDIEAIEFNQLLDNKAMGTADIFRTSWVGDYPTPEAFLSNAYGKLVPSSKKEPSSTNSARFKNAEFDRLLEMGISAKSVAEANGYFSDAEKVLMDEAVFIILWYAEDMDLKQAAIRDFETNGIGYIDLKKTYFKTPTAKEYADK